MSGQQGNPLRLPILVPLFFCLLSDVDQGMAHRTLGVAPPQAVPRARVMVMPTIMAVLLWKAK